MGKNRMTIKEFIEQNREALENNPNVLRVGKTISYSPEFKVKAVELKQEGYTAREIFEDNGLYYKGAINRDYLLKWAKQYKTHGKESFFKETRGKNANGKSGRPKKQELTDRDKVLIQEKIIEAQRQEIENLKKQLWLGKVVQVNDKHMPKQMIFSFIHDLNNKIQSSITELCEYFSVSRSGYYKWLSTAPRRERHEKQDLSDFEDIKYIWLKSDKTAGYRTVYMNLRNDEGIIMNPKKIYRLMKKFGIRSIIRKKNPYKHLYDAYKSHHYFKNVLDRNFNVDNPGTVFATDITYLTLSGKKRYYLSAVKDLCTREIVAWKVSKSLAMSLSIDVIDQLVERYGEDYIKENEILIHSDQGFHYTNPKYVNKLKKLNVTQSMSRRGNCLDNAKMETFFGHFKDECKYNEAKDMSELTEIIESYMDFYNTSRYQWTLKKMAPAQYRNHLLTA